MMDFAHLAQSGKAVLGTQNTLKHLRQGKLTKIYISQNCPLELQQDAQHQAQLVKTEVEILTIPNHELGTLCKKPFSINLLGQLR